MPSLRHDPLSGRDVIVAAGRAARPTTFASSAADEDTAHDCPFCPGNEATTPPEVARVGWGEADGPGWSVRAVPNLYPIVEAHEVVVLSPDHRSSADLDDDEVVAVWTLLRDRVRAHLDAGNLYGVAIVNHRRAAGASIAHPHAQVLALDLVPPAVEAAVARFAAAGVDLVAADVVDELVIADAGDVVVWSPVAASSPHLFRLAHRGAGAHFDAADDPGIRAVAVALRDALRRLRAALGDVPYNVVVHTAPRPADGAATPFHWYVEVVPRVSIVAGFEQATGILVNTVPPEQSVEVLRAASAS
jgi:UDPglucose--hexose-1-phosphate uridylyltransferase